MTDRNAHRQYSIRETKQYRRDVRRVVKSGFDLTKLEAVIDILATGVTLPGKYMDHELKGTLAGIRECHIGPDWLLLYTRDRPGLILILTRTGTHSRLFNE
ncbi:MAG: type II toxin-antitoxin system YafQ family toxin [Candidatus Peregrinibacteria bacterium]|nr:type II toxin-antitoxin system YafQ family toxin [Candidatus Peregrinibacteria bacterium]